jgi:hypothetical protein
MYESLAALVVCLLSTMKTYCSIVYVNACDDQDLHERKK